ncbi:hypothetical protein PG997_001250 [Apiospora hydei]|uniref:Uncharacterized protein n=1 Tax=Apiospora hydei TaxID=1337664 RepID=A0ABR1XCZ5_9PEZI
MATPTHVGANSSPIARHILQGTPMFQNRETNCPDVSRKIIPGCSAAEHGKGGPLLISNTMLQAYNMMRGPAAKDSQEDPLFEWIHLREDISSRDDNNPAPTRSKRDIFRMLHKVDETLSHGNAAGDSPREAVFEINRPAQADHHIPAPPRHDFSTHLLTACCADFEFESDDSDDEESLVPHGRISPCTFLAWSKGCQLWSGDNIKVDIDQGWDVERQVDEETGCELSPCYAVPTSPSLLYLPEGVDAVRAREPTAFEGRYSRMDPLAGKQLRKLMFFYRPNAPSDSGSGSTPTASPTAADVGVEEYGHSEIEAILNSPSARHHAPYPGIPVTPSQLDQHLGQAYAAIAANEAQGDGVTQLLRHQTTQIRCLQEEREHLSAAVYIVQNRRRRQQQEEEQRQIQQQNLSRKRSPEEKRQKQIRKHLAGHLNDIQFKFTRAVETLGHDRVRKEANEAAIARLETDIAELCREAGLGSPAEVYDELTGRSPDDDGGSGDAGEHPATAGRHQHNDDNNSKAQSGNDHEGGGRRVAGGAAGTRRLNTEGGIYPPMSPLLVTKTHAHRQPIVTTITPRSKTAQTRRSRPSPTPPPLVQAGALSPLNPNHHHHQVGELEDDPLPRLKAQYLEMMTPKNRNNDQSRPSTIGRSHGPVGLGDKTLHNDNNSSGYAMDASPMKNNRLGISGGGGAPPSLYEAEAGSEDEYYDEAEYQATEKVLENAEAFIERLQQR